MYNNEQELAVAMLHRMSEVQDPNLLSSDPDWLHLCALSRVYSAAMSESEEYGWVGVGCITFAENRLRSYQQHPNAELRGFDEYGHYGENNPPVGGAE
jgi:hypothetical protein